MSFLNFFSYENKKKEQIKVKNVFELLLDCSPISLKVHFWGRPTEQCSKLES
jgi:hypothetical protein